MLSSFSLTSWRGIDTLTIDLGQHTYIQWANGSGKTHILDAIHMLSGSRPLYGDATLEMGSEFEGIFVANELRKSYRIVRDETREYYGIQWSKSTKPKYMTALPWRTVHISPFDMNLLYFAPAMRRDYIDLILARSYAQFPGVRRDYERSMQQRNALLKKIRDGLAKRENLDFWDAKFAEYAEVYGLYRTRYRDYVRAALVRFPQFFGKYSPEFDYQSSIENSYQWDNRTDAEIIIWYLKDNRERDILTGHTHIGPHRDDWGFSIERDGISIPAQEYLSRGEMKMLLLWLKMIEQDCIAQILDMDVILLVDDIFAELDDSNSQIFLDSLMQYQVILTSQKPLPNHEKYHHFTCINLGND